MKLISKVLAIDVCNLLTYASWFSFTMEEITLFKRLVKWLVIQDATLKLKIPYQKTPFLAI